MTLIIDESFEGTGYEETWSESTGGGTVDEDSVGVAPPTGGGSQTLHISGHSDCYARRDLNQDYAITFTSFYVQIHSHDASIYNYDFIRGDTDGWARSWYLRLQDSGGEVYFTLQIYTNGSDTYMDRYPASGSISLDTWYKVDVKYDTTNMLWEWRVNNSVEGSGSLTGTVSNGVGQIFCGCDWDAEDADYYFDLVKMDDSGYPAYPATGSPYYAYAQQ